MKPFRKVRSETFDKFMKEIIINVEKNCYTVNIPLYERDINGNRVGKSLFTYPN